MDDLAKPSPIAPAPSPIAARGGSGSSHLWAEQPAEAAPSPAARSMRKRPAEPDTPAAAPCTGAERRVRSRSQAAADAAALSPAAAAPLEPPRPADEASAAAGGSSAPQSAASSPLGSADKQPRRFGSGQHAPARAAKWPPPERKIWMRSCNECGVELHVRRTKCTSCGSVQVSKRESSSPLKHTAAADGTLVDALLDGAPASSPAPSSSIMAAENMTTRARADKEGAACASSALTLLAGAAPLSDAACAPAALLSAATPTAKQSLPASPDQPLLLASGAPGGAGAGASASAGAGAGGGTSAGAAAEAAASSGSSPEGASPALSRVVSALARLTPEQLLKVRRIHKLRALLARLPPGVMPPASRRGGGAAADPSGAEAPATAEDAIAILANVACM